MSKSQAKTKGQNPGEYGSDTQGTLDANESAKSMNSGKDDTSVNQNRSGDSSGSFNEEGTHQAFGEPESLESNSDSRSSSLSSQSKEEGGLLSKATHAANAAASILSSASSAMDTQAMKKNLNLVKDKAQTLYKDGKEQISSKYSSMSDDVRLRGMYVDDKVKASPYAWALGAAGLGFVLGRVFSGKGKQDLAFVKTTLGKVGSNIDMASIASLVGVSLSGKDEEVSSSSPNMSSKNAGYNEKQARKIG